MTRVSPVPVTHVMANFALSATWEQFPEPVRKQAARAWLNWVACTVGAARMPAVDAAVKGALLIAAGDVPVLGRPERVSLSDAALLGSLSAAAHTFDDTHLSTITHPTGPVASALLACAYQQGEVGKPVSGVRVLNALAVGIELECRVSCALAAGNSHPGWYMTGLSGGIGAAAAVGNLLGLSHDQMVSALGLAATQASGFRATHGSMAIAFVPGIAARDGLVAAYMAGSGFACSDIAIDGKNGLLHVLTGGNDSSLLVGDLGAHYEMLNNAYKPYPCGIVIHPAIDACLHLFHEAGVVHQNIESVDMRVHPDALNLCWRKSPDNVLDAQVSLYHWVAAALVHGLAGVQQGELSAVQDPSVRGLQARSQAVVDPVLGNNQAVVVIRLRDGTILERMTEDALGSVTNPMSDAQLAAKFAGLVAPILGDRRASVLLEKCQNMSTVQSVAEILQLGTC